MERKIGEIFEYDGEWYQCVEGNGCENCAFKARKCYLEVNSDDLIGECCYDRRRDNKDVIFKKLEKVGEPYEYFIQGRGIRMVQEYILKNPSYIWDDKKDVFVRDCYNGRVEIEIKQSKEDMEEKKIRLRQEEIDFLRRKFKDITQDYVIQGCDREKTQYEFGMLFESTQCPYNEEKKLNLKTFDFEAAKAGKPVCTRDGRKARIICFDAKYENDYKPIIALIDNGINEFTVRSTKDGECSINAELDLMMLPEKKEGWVNVYYNRIDGTTFSKHPYPSKEEAIKNAGTISNRIDTVKVIWEE